MIVCPQCQSEKSDGARFCDECGTRLVTNDDHAEQVAAIGENSIPSPIFLDRADSFEPSPVERAAITTFDSVIEPAVQTSAEPDAQESDEPNQTGVLATLTIERGDAPGTVFQINNPISVIGRWDADNGIFPDVDLDAYDPDAKVSRKHAKITIAGGKYFVEDLGSTNGTYINRGRRLLPGTPQPIADGDEVIVGKTFLRFKAT